jgi:hypothetical protein
MVFVLNELEINVYGVFEEARITTAYEGDKLPEEIIVTFI